MNDDVVVIDIAAKFTDKTDPGMSGATKKVDKFDDACRKTQERLKKLGNTSANPTLNVRDRATEIVSKVTSSIKNLSGKTFSFACKVVDYATKPLRSILNFATSIKGIVTGIFAGMAAKKLVLDPVTLADSLTSAQIGFETLFKSTDKAQKMMDDINKFAQETPFKTAGVISQTQKMIAMGWNPDKIIKDLRTIGDAAAATGKGDAGLESITYALAEIKSKGKLSTQELNQLASAGIKAKAYIAQGLGYGTDDKGLQKSAAAIEKGMVGADQAIGYIMNGMKEFDGMMNKTANKTVDGLKSQIEDAFEISVITKWGRGLQNGAIKGLGKVVDLLNTSGDGLSKIGDMAEEFAYNMSTKAADALGGVIDRFNEVTQTDKFKNADLGGKIKIIWSDVIAKPFDKWWNDSGQKWMADKAEGIGKGLGNALEGGLLAILGVDAKGALSDGLSIGGSFADGFMKGFDGKKVGEAIKSAIEKVFSDAFTLLPGGKKPTNTSGLSAGLIVAVLGKLGILKLGGKLAGKGLKAGASNLWGKITGKGSKNGTPDVGGNSGTFGGTFSTQTMAVKANIVYVNGKTVNSKSGKTRTGNSGGSGSNIGTDLVVTGGSAAAGFAGAKLLTSGTGLLTSGTSGLLLGGGGAAGATLTSEAAAAAGTSGVFSTAGAINATTGLTAAGTVAATASAIAGGILGALGLGSAGLDIYKGYKAGKNGDQKEAKDKYITAGTKTGMVATGAGVGAAIGSIVPVVGTGIGALIGAGVGGAGAIFGGNKAGKSISDLATGSDSDKSAAAMNKVKENNQKARDSIQEKWSGFSDWFGTNVWTPVSDTGITAINIGVGGFERGKDKVSKAWTGVADWFGDNVWDPTVEKCEEASVSVSNNFNLTKDNISSKWSEFTGWFDDNIWTPIKDTATEAGKSIQDNWNLAKDAISSKWSDFSSWFSENVSEPTKQVLYSAGQVIQDKWSEVKDTISSKWSDFSSWFGANVWEPAKSAASIAGSWVKSRWEEAKTGITNAWAGVSGWFESNVWTPIKNGATSAWNWASEQVGKLDKWAGGKWNSFTGWLSGLGDTGSEKTGLKTSEGKSTNLSKSKKAKNGGSRANGGFMYGPTHALVGEAGPEAIIPLGTNRRTRGRSLWEQAGRMMGLTPYADGGIVGNSDYSTQASTNSSTSPITVPVSVGGVTIQITVQNEDNTADVVTQIKSKASEVANVLSNEIANRLSKTFSNLPYQVEGAK